MSKRLSFSIAVNLLTDNFKKGAKQISSSFKSMQLQIMTFATALGAGGFGLMSLISQFKDVARETSRVLTALKNVSGTTQLFNQNLGYLNGLAKQYGLEVNSLISNFTSFTASATQVNMSMQDQKKIFESVSRATTAFALSSSQTDGVFLALSQMMSKGKVSMEELRNQMGEKLPIAMQAMAQALGVPISELDKMISTGKVLSKDVLPKFADALNSMTQNVDTDNLEASLNRLSNTFGDIVMGSGFQNKYKALIDWLNEALEALANNMKNVFVGILAVIGFVVGKTLDGIYAKVQVSTKAIEATANKASARLTSIEQQRLTTFNKLEALKQQQATATANRQIQLANQVARTEAQLQGLVARETQARAEAVQARLNRIRASQMNGFQKLGVAIVGSIRQIGVAMKGMLASSVIGLAIAGITVLVTKLYEYIEKSRELSRVQSEISSQVQKETSSFNSLFNQLKKTNISTDERKIIIKSLNDKYGEYLKNIDLEKSSLTELEGIQKRVNIELGKSVRLRAISEQINSVEDKGSKEYAKWEGDVLSIVADEYEGGKAGALTGMASARIQKIVSDFESGNLSKTSFENEFENMAISQIKDLNPDVKLGDWDKSALHGKLRMLKVGVLKQQETIAQLKKISEATEEEFQRLYNKDSEQAPPDPIESPSYQESYDKAKKEWEDKKKALQAIEADKKNFTQQQYIDAKTALEKAEKDFQDLGGETKDKTDKTISKRLDAQKKLTEQELALQREAERTKLEFRQKELDLEEDSFQKRQKQIELNYDKELQSIKEFEDKKRKDQESYAKGIYESKQGTDKGFDFDKFDKTQLPVQLSDSSIDADVQKQTQIANNQRIKANADLLRELLEQNQNYQQQKLAIETEYNKKISDLESFRIDIGDEAANNAIDELNKKKQKELSAIDLKEFQDSINWEQVFGNLDRLTTESLQEVRERLNAYIEEAGKTLSAQDAKVLVDALDKMNIEMADRKPINELINGYENYRNTLLEVAKAKAELNALEKGTDQYVKAQEVLTDAENKRKDALTNMSQSLNNIGSKGQQLVNAGYEIIDMLGAFGISVSESVSKALAGIGQIMGGLQNLDLNKPFSVVTSSITMLTGLGKTIAGIFGFGGTNKDTKRYEEMKAQYDALNKVWDDLISKKKEYIETSYGEEARNVGEEAKRLTEKQIESNRALGKAHLNSFKNKGGSSWGVRQQSRIDSNDWKDLANWKQKNNISDNLFNSATTGRMEGLFDLSAKQIESLKEEAPILWAKLNSETKEYLENIIAGGEQLDDINKALKEQYTQISLESFKDNFVDLLSDMDSSSQDFADNFEKYIQKAILSSLIGSKYKSQIESLYDAFAQANSDGNITGIEAEDLKKQQQALADQMLAEREALKDAMGWGDSTSSQQASKGYSTSMDQETGGAILGRITSIQMILLNCLESLKILQTNKIPSIDKIEVKTELMKHTNIMTDIKKIQTQNYFLLEESKNSLGEIKNVLGSIEVNTKGLL